MQRQPQARGVREPGSSQQVSRGCPPATPCHTSCAFKFRPGPRSLQSPLHSRHQNKKQNKTEGDGAGPLGAPRGAANSHRPPVTSPPLTQEAPEWRTPAPPEASPVTGRLQTPRPFSRTLATGARAPPLPRARLGLLPLQSPKCPPHLGKYAEEEFPIQLCQAVTSPPSRPTLSGHSQRERSLYTWDKAN